MPRAFIAGLAIVAIGGLASTAGGRPDTSKRPTLNLVKRAPLTVRGTNFKARERVRVTAVRRQWRARATLRGAFVLTLSGVDRCSWVRVVAVGDEGSRATLKALPAPACPPARSP